MIAYRFLAILFALSIIATSCFPKLHIQSDQLHKHDTKNYKTFKIVDFEEGYPKEANPINRQRIINAIFKKMTLSSRKRDIWNPDLIVSWYVKVDHKMDYRVYREYHNRWPNEKTLEVVEYDEGTMVIDMIDAKTKEIIWHGVAKEIIEVENENFDRLITKAVNSLLETWMEDNS